MVSTMKKVLILFIFSFVMVLAFNGLGNVESLKSKRLINDTVQQDKAELQFGDIIFQSSKSGQSQAIQLATNSQYSHVGMLFEHDDEWKVLEAVQPVKITPLSKWKKQGDYEYYEVKRLKGSDSLLTKSVMEKMKVLGTSWLGKDYDIYFDWSDTELYCSELVWKIYKENLGVEIAALRPLKDFDLTHPLVKKTMKERYGDDLPLESMMISPGDMYDSELLETVLKHINLETE